MTNADREELGRAAYEAHGQPVGTVPWEQQYETVKKQYRAQAEAVARKVLRQTVARLRDLSAKAREMKATEAAALLLRGVANEMHNYLDAPAEGRWPARWRATCSRCGSEHVSPSEQPPAEVCDDCCAPLTWGRAEGRADA